MPIDASTSVIHGFNPGNSGDGRRLPFDVRIDGWWQSRLARALAYRPQLSTAPLRKPHREGASNPARVTDTQATTERSSPHGERLLVVDSDPAYRKLVSEIAKDLDYSVEASRDGREFKQRYARFQPTAVVLDLLLPDGDGIQLLNFLIKEGSDARVIVISEINDRLRDATNTLASTYGLRIIANLPKPVEPETLRAALDPAAVPSRDLAG